MRASSARALAISERAAARALRAKKPVFVDLHGPDGAWVDTLAPVTGPEPPREWSTAGLSPGFLQIEAYQFTTSPGESAALARVQITDGAGKTITLTSNAAGNFYTSQPVTFPISAQITL